MEIRTFEVNGPIEIIPKKIKDNRGYFSEIFRLNTFRNHVSFEEFVQDNQSLSEKLGTIRGIHFQSHPAAQGKLVRCLAGKLLDVAVDIREDSPTFRRWISVVLSPEQNNQLWVPIGFGHAFCTLEPRTIVSYRVTNYYSPDNDRGLAWDDPDIGIEWPDIADPSTLSAKDRSQPRLSELPVHFSVSDK